MSNVLNITINQGEDFKRVLTIRDSSNAAINLTGFQFRGQAREKFNSSAAAFSFTFSIKNQGTNLGQVDWVLPNSATTSIILSASKIYLYDVEMVNASGEVTRILQGNATLSPEVTK